MKLKLFLIAKGNSTLLVWDCPKVLRRKIINRYLGKEAEQIGFVSSGEIPTLTMMGGELCINATLSLARYLADKGQLLTSGVNEKVNYQNYFNKTSINMELKFRQQDEIILFEGIGFICKKLCKKPNKKELINFCKKYRLPAFGAILYEDNKSTPYVYVQNTDSLTAETACGSGSIALSIVTGFKNILQPSGGVISVKRNGSKFQVEAKVEEFNLKGGELICV